MKNMKSKQKIIKKKLQKQNKQTSGEIWWKKPKLHKSKSIENCQIRDKKSRLFKIKTKNLKKQNKIITHKDTNMAGTKKANRRQNTELLTKDKIDSKEVKETLFLKHWKREE